MAKFRKSLHFDELERSESDREENLVCEDRDQSPLQLRRNNVVGSQNHAPSYESTTLRDRILTTFQKSFVSVSLFNFMDVSSISNWLNFVFTISSIH